MALIDLKGEPFRIRLDGPADAPVLVLHHALGADLDVWQPQIAAFSRHFRVLRFDCRGHGTSTVSAAPYGLERLGGDVVALLDALGLERVHFCGLSMGGLVGQWLGLHAPQRLDRLMLCQTAARIGSPDLWDGRIRLVEAGGMAAVVRLTLERWFTPAFLASPSFEPERVAGLLRACPPVGFAASCAVIRDADLRGEVQAIAVPTLVVTGTQDKATPPEDGRALAASIPGARPVELSGPHMANVEMPEAFNRTVLDFLMG